MRYTIHTDLDKFMAGYNHIDYCEVAIGPNGEIYELVCTSHQDMLIHIAFGKYWHEMPEDEAEAIYNDMGNLDVLEYLCAKTGCCAMWYYSLTIPRQGITEAQFDTITRMYKAKKHNVNLTSMTEFPPNVGYHKIGRPR